MIQINLTLSVSLDTGDLDALDKLAAIGRGIRLLAENTEPTQRHAEEPLASPRADSANASLLPTAQNGPKRREKPARPPTTPASYRTPVLTPIPAVEKEANGIHESNGIDKPYSSHESPANADGSPHPSNRLPFADFDRLCRAEMKRLSMDGRLPGHNLWNSERNPQLPTMAAVLLRYKAATLVELATILGLEPPLSAAKERGL